MAAIDTASNDHTRRFMAILRGIMALGIVQWFVAFEPKDLCANGGGTLLIRPLSVRAWW